MRFELVLMRAFAVVMTPRVWYDLPGCFAKGALCGERGAP